MSLSTRKRAPRPRPFPKPDAQGRILGTLDDLSDYLIYSIERLTPEEKKQVRVEIMARVKKEAQ